MAQLQTYHVISSRSSVFLSVNCRNRLFPTGFLHSLIPVLKFLFNSYTTHTWGGAGGNEKEKGHFLSLLLWGQCVCFHRAFDFVLGTLIPQPHAEQKSAIYTVFSLAPLIRQPLLSRHEHAIGEGCFALYHSYMSRCFVK